MSNDRTFKTGDLVSLRSGGPPMTVAECKGDVISCLWFNDKVLKRQDFAASMLTVGDLQAWTDDQLERAVELLQRKLAED
jgi:uncharacterized protein YodC (DUF2158 family)